MFGAKLSWCQIVRCQIVLVPNCPGAKLSTFIILVPNCPLLLSWCQIVPFIILVPNCPVPNCPTISYCATCRVITQASATNIIFGVNQWWLLDDYNYHHQYHHYRQQSDQSMQDCQHINYAWLRFGSVIQVSDIPSLHKFPQIFQSHHWTGQSNLVPLIFMAIILVFEFMQCRQGWKGE